MEEQEITFEQFRASIKIDIQVLARFFGWTFETIESMTCDQIRIALEIVEQTTKANENSGKPGLDGNLHFSTLDEWKLWKEMRG